MSRSNSSNQTPRNILIDNLVMEEYMTLSL